MPIPIDVLDIERPTNTVVAVYGNNKEHCVVKKRTDRTRRSTERAI